VKTGAWLAVACRNGKASWCGSGLRAAQDAQRIRETALRWPMRMAMMAMYMPPIVEWRILALSHTAAETNVRYENAQRHDQKAM